MENRERYDLVIIGAGPGGYVAAIRAAQLGLSTALVEKDDRLGGTCLLRGCIPTKSLLESAEVADRARAASKFGVGVGEVTIDLAGVHKRKDAVVRQNANGVAFLMKKNGVAVHRGHGRLVGAGQVAVRAQDGAETVLRAGHVILATGSAPRGLPGVEIDGEAVVTSDEILGLPQMPEHLLVLGGGAVGVELASVYRSFGAQVTVVEMLDRLVPIEDDEICAELSKVFRRRRIEALTATRLAGLERVDGGVRARLEPAGGEGEARELTVSHVLVAVGRRPVTEGLGLEGTGVELDRGFVRADALGRTGEPGVYAIGDIVAGTPLLAHVASAEGIVAAEHIAGRAPVPVDYDQVPSCTYSHPEIGSIGLTERAARERGHELKVGRFPFSAVGKAKVLGDTNGFVKIVAEAKYGQILGVHIIGPRATDLIAEAGPLLKLECTVEELSRTIHAHPTLAEGILEAAHATLGHAIHI